MSGIGLFGKTPSARDFVRVNIGAPVVRAFDEYLRQSVMTLPSLRAHLPPEPLPFMFRAPGNDGQSRAEFGLADKLRITTPNSYA